MARSSSHKKVISNRWLLPAVVLCLVGAALCIPGKDELLRRHGADGDSSSVKEMAEEARKDKGVVDAAAATDLEKLKLWLDNDDSSVLTDPAILMDTVNMCAASEQPLELMEELLKHDAVPDDLRQALLEGMAKGAIGRGGEKNIETGAAILSRLCRLQPSWPLAGRAVEAWLWSGNARGASAIMEFMAVAVAPAEGAPADLLDRRIQLAMASGQPDVAFAAAKDAYMAAVGEARPALLHRALDLAQHTSSSADAGTLMQHHLSSIPFHTVPLGDAVTLVRDRKAFATADAQQEYLAYADKYARLVWAEEKGGPLAFEVFLRMSLLGDDVAWEICEKMRDDLLRDDAFALVLRERIAAGQSTDREALLADLLAAQGETREAVNHYRSMLGHERGEWERWTLLEKYAEVLMETGDYAGAAGAHAEILKNQPSAYSSHKHLGFCFVRMGRYDEARKAYAAASVHLPEDELLQNCYASLCESTGHFSEAITARYRILNAPHHNTLPDDFLEISDSCRILGDTAQQIAVLEQGLKRFPASPRLRFVLAESCAAGDRHARAIELLAHETLRNDPAAMELLISEATITPDPGVALAFLGDKAPACFREQPVQLLRLAFLYEQTQRVEAAETIFQGLLGNTRLRENGTFQLLAKTSLEYGDANRAEIFQSAHLQLAAASRDSKSWRLMGDIYSAQQRPDKAGEAYQKAVAYIIPARDLASTAGPDH